MVIGQGEPPNGGSGCLAVCSRVVQWGGGGGGASCSLGQGQRRANCKPAEIAFLLVLGSNLPSSLEEEAGGATRGSTTWKAVTISCPIASQRESDTRSPSIRVSGVEARFL